MRTAALSQQQLAYAEARARYEIAYEAHRAYGDLMDVECTKLGIATPYGILPDGHPMWAEGQRLLDVQNAASTRMYAAAHALFDWATSETFKRCGTPQQRAAIGEAVEKIKKMAYVEKPFIQLVDMSMRLPAGVR